MKVPMQLDDFVISRLSINWREPTKSSVDVSELGSYFDYNVKVSAKDETRYRVDLKLKLWEVGKQEANVGYEIEADLTGVFEFNDDSDKQARQKIVRVNGVHLLYSTFRGALGTMTGLFPGGKMILPTIMPVDVVRAVESRKVAERATPKDVSPPKAQAQLKKENATV